MAAATRGLAPIMEWGLRLAAREKRPVTRHREVWAPTQSLLCLTAKIAAWVRLVRPSLASIEET